MDAITMLREDHKLVEKLFKQFEKAGDEAYAEKRRIVDQIIAELTAHATAEEQCFYPAVREAVPDVEDTVLEGLEEHHIAKVTLSELAELDPRDERFTPKATVLMESVRHHIEEEEGEIFPEVRKALGRTALQELGEVMVKAKEAAPAGPPSPDAPDTPPENLTRAARDVAARALRAVTGAGSRTGSATSARNGSRTSRR